MPQQVTMLQVSPPTVQTAIPDPREGCHPSAEARDMSPLTRTALYSTYRSLEDINLRSSPSDVGAVTVDRSRMRLALTRATGQTLARQEGQVTVLGGITILRSCNRQSVESLVCDSADIARVVGVWPCPIRRRAVSWTSEITHCPNTRPL